MLLSRMPDLKLLYLQFQSPRSILDQEVQSRRLPPLMHIVFPALISFFGFQVAMSTLKPLYSEPLNSHFLMSDLPLEKYKII
jgi:hypothetical protein